MLRFFGKKRLLVNVRSKYLFLDILIIVRVNRVGDPGRRSIRLGDNFDWLGDPLCVAHGCSAVCTLSLSQPHFWNQDWYWYILKFFFWYFFRFFIMFFSYNISQLANLFKFLFSFLFLFLYSLYCLMFKSSLKRISIYLKKCFIKIALGS